MFLCNQTMFIITKKKQCVFIFWLQLYQSPSFDGWNLHAFFVSLDDNHQQPSTKRTWLPAVPATAGASGGRICLLHVAWTSPRQSHAWSRAKGRNKLRDTDGGKIWNYRWLLYRKVKALEMKWEWNENFPIVFPSFSLHFFSMLAPHFHPHHRGPVCYTNWAPPGAPCRPHGRESFLVNGTIFPSGKTWFYSDL